MSLSLLEAQYTPEIEARSLVDEMAFDLRETARGPRKERQLAVAEALEEMCRLSRAHEAGTCSRGKG